MLRGSIIESETKWNFISRLRHLIFSKVPDSDLTWATYMDVANFQEIIRFTLKYRDNGIEKVYHSEKYAIPMEDQDLGALAEKIASDITSAVLLEMSVSIPEDLSSCFAAHNMEA